MIENKYYIVKYMHVSKRHDEAAIPMYAQGYGKWTQHIDQAKLYVDVKSATRLAKQQAPGGFQCELLHATLTVEDTNDLLEKALDLN